MTKEEFKGFGEAAQHDMVLEALVRVTQNLETVEKESGKPFVGTAKQNRNDVKLLTILAEAFGKNELVWEQKPRVTVDAGKYIPGDKGTQGIRDFKDYMDKSKPQPLNPVDGIQGIADAEKKIVEAQQKAGKFQKVVVAGVGMERYNSKSMQELVEATDDKSIYPVKSIAKSLDNSGLSKGVIEGFKKVSNERMAKRRSK